MNLAPTRNLIIISMISEVPTEKSIKRDQELRAQSETVARMMGLSPDDLYFTAAFRRGAVVAAGPDVDNAEIATGTVVHFHDSHCSLIGDDGHVILPEGCVVAVEVSE